ncbi:MAG: hypothetical protein R3D25_20240 [Geminicoccaceae bacterium]
MLGEAFAGMGERVVIATKIGTSFRLHARAALAMRDLVRPVGTALRPPAAAALPLQVGPPDFHPDAITSGPSRGELGSRSRPSTSCSSTSLMPRRCAKVAATAERLRKDGKIRHYGVACVDLGDALVALEQPGIAAVQIAINCLEPVGLDRLTTLPPPGVSLSSAAIRAIGLLTDAHEETMGDARPTACTPPPGAPPPARCAV